MREKSLTETFQELALPLAVGAVVGFGLGLGVVPYLPGSPTMGVMFATAAFIGTYMWRNRQRAASATTSPRRS